MWSFIAAASGRGDVLMNAGKGPDQRVSNLPSVKQYQMLPTATQQWDCSQSSQNQMCVEAK